jgi:hypothetical protein
MENIISPKMLDTAMPAPSPLLPSHHIGVVVPCGASTAGLSECLEALVRSAEAVRKTGLEADIYVVLGSANSECADITSRFAVRVLTADVEDEAMARAIGARAAADAGATWLAFTSSDAVVADTWLTEQSALQADLSLGTVEVTDAFLQLPLDLDQETNRQFSGANEDLPVALDFSNFAMSTRLFRRCVQVEDEAGRIDWQTLDALIELGVVTHHSDKPMVYRRNSTSLDELRLDRVSETPATQPAPQNQDFPAGWFASKNRPVAALRINA